jgi:hypothetical protein
MPTISTFMQLPPAAGKATAALTQPYMSALKASRSRVGTQVLNGYPRYFVVRQ